jgi:hypothetical protein
MTHTTVEHPTLVTFSLLQPLNWIPCEPGVILDRIPLLPVSSVHRIPVDAAVVRHVLNTVPYFISD